MRSRALGAVGFGLVVGALAWSSAALAQPAPVTPPAGPAPAPAPAPDAPGKDAAPLPPVEKDAWGVGGKDQEGEWAPGAQRKKADAEKKAEDEDEAKPAPLPPAANIQVDTVLGFGGVNVVTDQPQTATKVTVVSILPAVSYRFGEIWHVGLRIPFSTGSSTGPLGAIDKFNQYALGNLEILVRPTFQLTKRLHLPAQVAFLPPTAMGQYFVEPNDTGNVARAIVNQAAGASRGWEENALFATKRVGIVPGVGLTYDRGAAHAAVGTKLEIMVKAGGNEPQDANVKSVTTVNPGVAVHGAVTNWVTSLSFFYDFFDGKLAPGLRAWLAVNSAPITDATVDYSGAQFVLEPDVTTKIPLGKVVLHGAVGGIVPVGGHLGGGAGASIGGVRLRVGLMF
jgi:hypothetical protein